MTDSIFAHDLEDYEREYFTHYFCLSCLKTNDTLSLWAYPWRFNYVVVLTGDTLEQMIENYFEVNKAHIERGNGVL